jgi:hypothetical protein
MSLAWIKSAVDRLTNRINALILRAVVSRSLPIKKGDYAFVQITYLGKETNMEYISPYGLGSALPQGASAIKFNINGQDSNKLGFGYDPATLPDRAPGEVVVGAFSAITPTYLKFTNQGTIEVWKTIAGVDTLVISDLITHAHSGVVTGGAVSGPPVL